MKENIRIEKSDEKVRNWKPHFLVPLNRASAEKPALCIFSVVRLMASLFQLRAPIVNFAGCWILRKFDKNEQFCTSLPKLRFYMIKKKLEVKKTPSC